MRIDVKSREGREQETASHDETVGEEIQFDYKEKTNSIDLFFDSTAVGKEVAVYLDKERILTARIGEKARLKFSKKTEVGKKISYGLRTGKKITIVAS